MNSLSADNRGLRSSVAVELKGKRGLRQLFPLQPVLSIEQGFCCTIERRALRSQQNYSETSRTSYFPRAAHQSKTKPYRLQYYSRHVPRRD